MDDQPAPPTSQPEPTGPLTALRLRQLVDDVALPGLPRHAILVNTGPAYRLEERLDGRLVHTFGVRGDIAIVPAGAPATFRTRERGAQQVESVALLLDPAFVRALAESAELDPARVELRGLLGGRDPALERLALAAAAELEAPGLLGSLYLDSLATGLAVHLLRRHAALAPPPAPTGGLTPAALRRVSDYVEAELDGALTVATLAAQAGLSPFHFARRFRQSTGHSPHEYVVARRVARAQLLLATTELPLHDIALRCGFADQSHLTRQLRRHTGLTPRAFREATNPS